MALIEGKHLIDGDWQPGSGVPFESVNPYTREPIWRGNSASVADVAGAVTAADQAFDGWRRLTVEEREAYLRSFTDCVKARRERLISAVAEDAGKPTWEAATEVDALVGKLAPTIEAQELRNSTRERSVGAATSVTRFRPHGAVAVLGPFNFPASMANSHMMPALLAGNTVVVKPSEQTPLVGQLMSECWSETQIPDGVVNFIHGGGDCGALLANDERGRGIFLTGSTRAGQALTEIAQQRRVPPILALEMGGNSPLVVWDYDSLETAVFIALQSAFISAGQRCSAARRLIVRAGDTAFLDKAENEEEEVTS